MTHDTMIPLSLTTPPLRHRALMRLPCFGLCPQNLDAMRDLEIAVAKHLLVWLTTQPAHTTVLLQALTDDTSPLRDEAQRLTYALWDETQAARWISPRDARSPRDLLWQFALIRLARRLNSGTWEVGV